MGAFRLVTHVEDLPKALERALTDRSSETLQVEVLPASVRQATRSGHTIAEAIGTGDVQRVVRTIIDLFDEMKVGRR